MATLWKGEEIQALKDCYSARGPIGVQIRLTQLGLYRTRGAILSAANLHGLVRDPWTSAEDDIAIEARMQGVTAWQVSEALANKGYDRIPTEVTARLRELDMWELRRTEHGIQPAGHPYRPLTRDTVHIIRLWHSQGMAPQDIADMLKRARWFVDAVLAGDPWQERWEHEAGRLSA